ncbi:MAG TPA: cytochrome-c oxidase, cbb3-type subunit III [Gammaproteobacteria bacterium]|nr:cytochrome-c oxidase, cbb3-type subunit III [Gammaproteobacteria bacterium]
MTLGVTIFVVILVVAQIVGAAWLMMASSRTNVGEGATTGHVWDGDVVEGNNPLPRWWLGLFWLTIVFAIAYVLLYPSFGTFSLLGWSEIDQYDREVKDAEAIYGKLFASFAATPIEELAKNPAALSAGRNLFVNNCAQCHGSDARGARGFPNLTDDEWLGGGEPAQIENTIKGGRTGVMPAFGAGIPEEQRNLLTDYVQHLAGREIDAARVEQGRPLFLANCSACHGPDGQGNQLIGAPKLANEIWLHGSGRSTIFDVITNGRTNQMPAQEPILGADRVHVLAAYVYSLSHRN